MKVKVIRPNLATPSGPQGKRSQAAVIIRKRVILIEFEVLDVYNPPTPPVRAFPGAFKHRPRGLI